MKKMIFMNVLFVVVIIMVVVVFSRTEKWIDVSEDIRYMEESGQITFLLKESPSQETLDDLINLDSVEGVKMNLEGGVRLIIITSPMYTQKELFDEILEVVITGMDVNKDIHIAEFQKR